MGTLTYPQARMVVLGFGAALICGVAIASFYRGADVVEVGATVLFLPVLAGLVLGRVAGGVAAAVAVSVVYVAVRLSTLGGLPTADFLAPVSVRVLLYAGFGVFGGWANDLLAQGLLKLELYDEVDDDTGVGNARALVSVLDREVERAARYGSVFSLLVVHLEDAAFAPVDGRRAARALRRTCQSLEHNLRTTDLINRVAFPTREDVVVVLPETGRAGVALLAERAVASVRQLLADHSLTVSDDTVHAEVLTVPGDEEAVRSYHAATAAVLGREVVTVNGATP
ncbi:MAG: diguanylate cyclase [Actinobacteria bacterium]|nr:diguanylate cyclase [Actinomycetota bacterium]